MSRDHLVGGAVGGALTLGLLALLGRFADPAPPPPSPAPNPAPAVVRLTTGPDWVRFDLAAAPAPTPTPTPDPGPSPLPPTPPAPAPTPAKVTRALIFYDQRAGTPEKQLNVLNAPAVWDGLDRLLPRDAAGHRPWFMGDRSTAFVGPNAASWSRDQADALAKARADGVAFPFVALATDRGLRVAPVPDTEAAFLDLLKPYGGG